MPGFDWSTYSKEIGNSKKIRMSIQAEGSAIIAFAETKEANPNRILYKIGFDGNYISKTDYRKNHSMDTPDPGYYQPGMLLPPNAHREENTLWKDKPRWFEINFVTYDAYEPAQIEIATIANEDGEGKQVWSTF